MYASIYIYRLPKENVDAFLQIQKEAAEIYQRYGALADETFAPVDLKAKYGCVPIFEALDVEADEEIFIGISRFRNRAHHDRVMSQVDSDERIGQLYGQVTKLLDINRVVRGEFEQVV